MIAKALRLEAGDFPQFVRLNSYPVNGASLIFVAVLTSCLTVASSQAGGRIFAWGDNSQSQTNVPASLTNAIVVAGGSYHSLALDANGAVLGWGDGSHGETTAPAGLSNVTAIVAGAGFSLALQANGDVVGWGTGTTFPEVLSNEVAIAAASGNGLALNRDGIVTPWGAVSSVPANVTNVVAIAAGYTHDLALRGDGTVIGWGSDASGTTAIPSDLTNVVALSAGRFHSLALKGDGTVVAWGNDTFHQLEMPSGLANVVAISAGGVHSLALKSDGTVVAWGDNTYHQLDVPAGLSNVFRIAAGRYHNLAIAGDGAPTITVQPVCRYDSGTGQATFQVMALGNGPLSYQWQRDSSDIADATNSILVLDDLAPAEAGAYSVVVTNNVGLAESAVAMLPPAWRHPYFLMQPQDASVPCREEAGFVVNATGSKPLSYQWYFDGTAVEGATNYALVWDRITPDQGGPYYIVVTNVYGAVTSRVASLTVLPDAPLITSSLVATGKQGAPFNYTLTGLHEPTTFTAKGLPFGLNIDNTTGEVQGTPVDSGVFEVLLGTANLCGSATTNLTLTVESSRPAITSPLTAFGLEQAVFNYQITATESPVSFGARGLPQGLTVDPASGVISGFPLYSGEFDTQVTASNVWGIGTATLHLSFSNAPISGLAIENVTTNYSSPYLLDFQFALRDGTDPSTSHAVVVDPQLLSVTGLEDGVPISPSETAITIQRGSAKVLKAYLVLDFTKSIADPLANGDTNGDGISDAVDAEVSSAQQFVNVQPADAQVGIYEFHRENADPQQVVPLTANKALLNASIGGIWTNYVQGHTAGSRCWDALVAAIGGLGVPNADEQHFVVFVSDGQDESSSNTLDDVLTAATNNNVQVYCVGFGDELNAANLQLITSQTSGRYYEATNASNLASNLAQIGKDLSGQYILRWATLKRFSGSFMPSFRVGYQGFIATSPPNPPPFISGTNEVVDTTTQPPTTNYVPVYTTNYIISPYPPADYAGDVTVGSLRLVADADVHPSGVTLRATYIPGYVTQILLHYRPNWPCTTSLRSTNVGEMLYGWTLTETNDGAGGRWALLSSPDPQSLTSSLPFASFGKLLTFSFRDMINASNSFGLFDVDNSLYVTNGGPSFVLENADTFVADNAVLPNGTPVPWLQEHGFTNDLEGAELSDPDGDGALTWQEYQAGTDPRDPNSRFTIRNVAPTDVYGRYQITFTTTVNRNYRLETSDDLVTWKTLMEGIVGTGNDMTVTDIRNPFDDTQAYYRVVVY